jgi:hypothetical protein
LQQNPLPSFVPGERPTVIMCTATDGLMRVPHLATAGKVWGCIGLGGCVPFHTVRLHMGWRTVHSVSHHQ